MTVAILMAYAPCLIIGLVLAGIVFGIGYCLCDYGSLFPAVVAAVVAFVISTGCAVGYKAWHFENTESGAREFHTIESNYAGGIEREVIVYNIQGDIIERYQGKFDLTYDNDRIMFDDENGKRHMIFYTTSNVIINEL